MKIKNLYFILIILVLASCAKMNNEEGKTENQTGFETLYVGTYTKKEGHVDGKGDGIYRLQMNKKTGELTVKDTILNVVNSSYIAIHPNKKYLYAVNEIADGNRIGTITAFNIEKDEIREIAKISSQGDAPCHISVDQTGRFVIVANYMEVVATYVIQDDGSLKQKSSTEYTKQEESKNSHLRQETSHPHMVLPAFDSNSIFVADLGLDMVYCLSMDEDGDFDKTIVLKTAVNAGPRHIVAHSKKSWLYVLNELNNTIEGYNYEGLYKENKCFQTINTTKDKKANVAPSAIKIHPNGKFLYSANRAINDGTINNISIFSINQENGKLELIQSEDTKGLVPRDFTISPSGQFLLVANQNSDTIITFKINQKTGKLEETNNVLKISTPVCLKFL